MKAKDLIAEIQKLDPEEEVWTWGPGYDPDLVKDINIHTVDDTEWDHRAKKPMHTTRTILEGEYN